MLSPRTIHKLSQPFKKISFVANFFYLLNRTLNACHIHPLCNLGNNIQFVHGAMGVVINRKVTFGKNIKIYQNVTIGNDGKGGVPTLGDNVTIYANSVVIGDIVVGENSIIGAMSLVNKDVPANTVWAGVPAKQIGTL